MNALRIVLLLGVLALVGGADWRQFRGTDARGVAPGAAPPAKFGPQENVAWKAELPGRGASSPIVVGDRVFVTASGGPKQDRLHVLGFDARTGKQLWQRSFWGTGPTDSHPKTCMAAPTPASDGKRLVALFATNDCVCLDLDGNVQWVRSLYEENPGATDGRGLATSPVLVGDTVIVQVENQNTSFAAGIDLVSGANRWRTDRPRDLNWSTPAVLPGTDPSSVLVLLQGTTYLSAIDPTTGSEVWHLDRPGDAIASSLVDGKRLYAPSEKSLTAFELQGRAAPKQLWEQARLAPATASPLVLDGVVYTLRGSILNSGDAKTGEVRGQLRLTGPFSSSPVSAGGLLYCVNESGQVQVVQPGDKEGKLLGTSALGEGILCTPAIADGALYLRSDRHLWKIAKP
jgi:outer membrane protein assembly factor BamB